MLSESFTMATHQVRLALVHLPLLGGVQQESLRFCASQVYSNMLLLHSPYRYLA